MVQLMILVAALGSQPVEGTRQITVDDAQVKLVSEVRVPAKEAGVLAACYVKEGDIVKIGQKLGAIDDRLAKVEMELAKLDHQIAKLRSQNDVDERYAIKSLEVSQSELKRSVEANDLYAASVSQTELERLQLVVDRSSLAIEQSQRDKEIADVTEGIKDRTVTATSMRLAHRKILAPMDGMVVEVFPRPGEWLTPGDPVVRIIELNRLRVEAYLDGKKFGPELKGCRVGLAVTLPPGDRVETFLGKIVFVSPELQPVTGEVRIWAEVENHGMRLRPGDHGQLTINLAPEPSYQSDSPTQQ